MSNLIDEIKGGEEMAAAKENKVNTPIINPVFQDMLDVQTEASYDELKKSIVAEGVRDPVVVWKETNTLIDGHNRLKIAQELGVPCPTIERSFADEAEAKTWIIRNQLGRRNLTPARFEYYIGKLYNEQKAETTEDKQKQDGKVAEKIGEEFQISEKTVRRYGTQTKGIDMLEKVRGKLAKNKQLSAKPEYSGEEIAAVAAASNTTVAAKTLKHIDSYKDQEKKKKVQNKIVKAAIAEKQAVYSVVLCEPEFAASGFSITTEPKPPLDKNSAVYMIVPDENLHDALKLIERWSLTYEASFIYWNSTNPYDGVYSKIVHQYLLMATKGTIIGPKAGTEVPSCILLTGEMGMAALKQIDGYHNGNTKKLDMRRGVKPLAGWDGLTK